MDTSALQSASIPYYAFSLWCFINVYTVVASFPDLPAHLQTLYTQLFFYPLRAGRSGQFGDAMMMSGGRGLVMVWKNDRRFQALPSSLDAHLH